MHNSNTTLTVHMNVGTSGRANLYKPTQSREHAACKQQLQNVGQLTQRLDAD